MIIFNFGAKFVAVCRTVYISMEYLETNIEQIRLWVKENYTHRMIGDTVKQSFPEVTRVFSERSIRLFCSQQKSIKKVIWKLIVLRIIKMRIHYLCGKVAHSL